MKVVEVMSKDTLTCSPSDTLDRAAQLMWEHDCGAVPITDDRGRTVAIVTDRDICIAAYTQGKALSEIPVMVAASKSLISATPDDTVETVSALMQENQIRRVPILDGQGKTLGIVGVGDIVRHFATARVTDGISADLIARTLAAISQPRAAQAVRTVSRAPAAGPVYHVKSVNGDWEVVGRDGRRVSETFGAQVDAVIHAKELARRDGSAQIIVHRRDGTIASEFIFQREERSALSHDETIPTLAASQPVHARRRARPSPSSHR
jgi:CBS domain-containing protein